MSLHNDSEQGATAPKGISSNAGDDDIVYESGWKPFLWLIIPLIAVVILGALTH